MAVCGLDISMNSFQGDVTARISGFLDLESSLTSPSGASTYLSNLEGGLAGLKAKTDKLVPDIPLSTSGQTSLRDKMGEMAQLDISTPSALTKIAEFAEKYAGLKELNGFANIDATDLAKSAFGFGASFDPCSLSNNIPNVVSDNVTGTLQKLPSIQPKLGGVKAAAMNLIPDQEVIDNTITGVADNFEIVKTSSVSDVEDALETNVQPALSALGDKIIVNNVGERVVETKEAVIEEIKETEKILDDVVPAVDPSRVMPNGSIRPDYHGIKMQKMQKSRLARKKALNEFKASSGLRKGPLLKAFSQGVKNGEIEYYGSDIVSGWRSWDDLPSP
jgi:hypothetical protein|tara:strand:+ start:695 stop:1693 length:999 start_codon:yes stop_codon:yes gene_type:complete